MSDTRVIRATLYVLSTEEGGRKTPLFSGYRAGLFVGTDERSGNEAIMTIEGRDECPPGEECIVRLEMVHPELVDARLNVDRPFELKEGGRVVGRGRITKLLAQ